MFRNNSSSFWDYGVMKGTTQELRVKDRYICKGVRFVVLEG